jgi:hypothetical protein
VSLHGSKIGNFRKKSGIGTRFQPILPMNNFPVIVEGRIFRRRTGGMFKCPVALYVDPQNLMTNRRNPPSGTGVGSEAKTMQATRYKYPCNLYCKPVNQSENTTKVQFRFP